MTRVMPAAASALLLAAFAAGPAFGAEDVRKVRLSEPQLKVIEKKCLVCHNRQRIDEAVQKNKDMAGIIKRMETKGVRLTETEHRVMGHFGTDSPLK
jgi:hypothetical protein